MTKEKQPQFKSILQKFNKLKINHALPYILIFTGIVGIVASFILIQEHIALLKDPAHLLSCNLNPVLSCGPVMESKTATQFGFPNPLLGLASFGAQILLGLVLLAGAKMKKWFWRLWGLQVLGSFGFMLFLMHASFFEIKAICIYCLSVWIALSISSWYTMQFMLAENFISLGKITKFVKSHHGDILISWFLLILIIILHEFWYYYGPKLGF